MNIKKGQNPQRLPALVYLLYILGILFGITALIGVIINHTQIHKTIGYYTHSHFLWQIVSFWVLAAGIAATILLWPCDTAVAIAWASLLWWLSTALVGCVFLSLKKSVPIISQVPFISKIR